MASPATTLTTALSIYCLLLFAGILYVTTGRSYCSSMGFV